MEELFFLVLFVYDIQTNIENLSVLTVVYIERKWIKKSTSTEFGNLTFWLQ